MTHAISKPPASHFPVSRRARARRDCSARASGSHRLPRGDDNPHSTDEPIARTQFYGTIGAGAYHETLSTQPLNDQTNIGTNIGGGGKITLAGPLRLRIDYRVFTLHGSPRHTPVQRIYAGINLKF
jgi:hypothetical protein